MHFCAKDEFEYLTNRYKEEVESEYASIDKPILPLIKAFNSIPGVVTTWSCSGHQFDQDKKAMMIIEKASDTWYLSFVITAEAKWFIEMLLEEIGNLNNRTFISVRPELSATKLLSLLSLAGDEDANSWYNCWNIRGSYNFEYPGFVESFWSKIISRINEHLGQANDERFALEA